jgi:hypothetical protein
MATEELKLDLDGLITPELRRGLEQLVALRQTAPDTLDDFLESLASPSELFSVTGEARVAEGANELLITFEPSQRLNDFLATVSAGDGDPRVL